MNIIRQSTIDRESAWTMKKVIIRCNAPLVVSFVFTVLAASGWATYLVGFAIRNSWNGTEIFDNVSVEYSCWWAVSVSGPVLLLFSLLVHHLIFHTATSSIYLPLVLFYYAMSSCVLQLDIHLLYQTHTERGLKGFSAYGFHVILEVAGLVVSLVCLGLSTCIQFTFLTRYFKKPTKMTFDPAT